MGFLSLYMTTRNSSGVLAEEKQKKDHFFGDYLEECTQGYM
jgi:hypothetical protein